MVLLCNIEDYQETIYDLKLEWIIEVLLKMGLDEEAFLDPTSDDTKKAMVTNGIEVFDTLGTEKTDIFYKKELAAQWKEPKRIRIREKDGKEYYQVHLNYWANIDLEFGKKDE